MAAPRAASSGTAYALAPATRMTCPGLTPIASTAASAAVPASGIAAAVVKSRPAGLAVTAVAGSA